MQNTYICKSAPDFLLIFLPNLLLGAGGQEAMDLDFFDLPKESIGFQLVSLHTLLIFMCFLKTSIDSQ